MDQNRKTFLKVLGLGGAGFILPANTSGLSFDQNGLLSQPVKIYDNYLRGTQYYHLEKCYPNIKTGDDLSLLREAGHQHDTYAIKVFWQEEPLGYIPAFENIVLANLMDSGAILKAMITEKKSKHELAVGIWTDLIVKTDKNNEIINHQRADDAEDLYRKGPY